MPVARQNSRQGRRRSAPHRTVSGQGHDLGPVPDDVGGAQHLAGCRFGANRRVDGERGPTIAPEAGELGAHDVLGEFQMGRTGLLRLSHGEGLAHRFGDDGGVRDPCVPLGDGPHEADHVDVLVALLVHPVQIALPGESDERCPVEIRVGHAGDQVGGPGSESAQADAGPPDEPAHGVGDERPCLLVTDGDELDRRLVEGLVQVERLLPGNAEHPARPLGFETLDQQVGGATRRHLTPRPGRGADRGGRTGNPATVSTRRWRRPRRSWTTRHA